MAHSSALGISGLVIHSRFMGISGVVIHSRYVGISGLMIHSSGLGASRRVLYGWRDPHGTLFHLGHLYYGGPLAQPGHLLPRDSLGPRTA
jgi:hypothetical protein